MTVRACRGSEAEGGYRGRSPPISQIKAGNTAWSETVVKDPQMRSRFFFCLNHMYNLVARGTPAWVCPKKVQQDREKF